jgi:hypothetical protein
MGFKNHQFSRVAAHKVEPVAIKTRKVSHSKPWSCWLVALVMSIGRVGRKVGRGGRVI